MSACTHTYCQKCIQTAIDLIPTCLSKAHSPHILLSSQGTLTCPKDQSTLAPEITEATQLEVDTEVGAKLGLELGSERHAEVG